MFYGPTFLDGGKRCPAGISVTATGLSEPVNRCQDRERSSSVGEWARNWNFWAVVEQDLLARGYTALGREGDLPRALERSPRPVVHVRARGLEIGVHGFELERDERACPTIPVLEDLQLHAADLVQLRVLYAALVYYPVLV